MEAGPIETAAAARRAGSGERARRERLRVPIGYALLRLRRQPARTLVVVLGIAVGAAVLAMTAVGSAAVQDRAVQRALAQLAPRDRAIQAVWSGVPAQSSLSFRQLDRTARATTEPILGLPPFGVAVFRQATWGGAFVNLGAVDGKTGSVLKFHANTNGTVLALSRNRSRLYLGGVFNTVRHKPRQHVAAVGMKGRLIRTWHPRTKGTVRSIRVARHGTPVYLGGAFTQINDQPGPFLAKVSAKGKVLPWRTYPDHPVWSLVVVSGHIFAGGNGPGGYVEAFSRRGDQGWNVHTDGGVQAMTWFHGALLVGGHFRKICTVRAGHGCAPALAFRDKLFSLNPATGALQRWNPAANSGLGVFAIRGAGSHVYVGGVFTKVNNLPQQGFDSFIRS